MDSIGKKIALVLIVLCILIGLSLRAIAWVIEQENETLREELVKTGKLKNILSHFNDRRTCLSYDDWKLNFWCPEEYTLRSDYCLKSNELFALESLTDEILVTMVCDSNIVYQSRTIWDKHFDMEGEKFTFSLKSGKEIEAIRWLIIYEEEDSVSIVSNYAFIANGKLFCLCVRQLESDFHKKFRLGEQLFACLEVKE